MKKYLKSSIKAAITIGIFVYLYIKFDVRLSDIFLDIDSWRFIMLGLICRCILVQFIAMNRWQLFLKHCGVNESLWTLLKINFVSNFLGVALPSSQGSDVVRMYWIEKRNGFSKEQKSTASSSVLIERMFGFIIIALIGLFNCIFLPAFTEKKDVFIFIATINIILWGAIFILTNKWCYTKISFLLLKIKKIKNITIFIEKTHKSLVTFPYRKILIASVILIGAVQLLNIFILSCVFNAFRVDTPFCYHMVFYPIIGILSVLPISISGLGFREGLYVFFYSLVGVSADLSIKISLINFCIETFSGVIIGGVIYALIQFHIIKPITSL